MTSEEKQPVVSVAIITYNQLPFLKEAISSVLAQNFKLGKIQIVVADDASTDGTRSWLESLEEFPQPGIQITKVLADENLGITPNTNAAFGACRGRYIAWLGGDDLMKPEKLQAQVKLMEGDPDCAICYHDVEVFDSESGTILRHFNSGARGIRPREGGAASSVRYGTFNCGCATMVRKEACPSYGFDVRIPVASDWLHWIETSRRGSIRYLDRVLGAYRRHSQNVTAVPRSGTDEFLLTLGIVESQYPDLAGACEYARGRMHYARAARLYQAGNLAGCRRAILAALVRVRISPKMIGLGLLAILGTKKKR